MAASFELSLPAIISHHFALEQISLAFETAKLQADGTLKVMVHLQPENVNNNIL